MAARPASEADATPATLGVFAFGFLRKSGTAAPAAVLAPSPSVASTGGLLPCGPRLSRVVLLADSSSALAALASRPPSGADPGASAGVSVVPAAATASWPRASSTFGLRLSFTVLSASWICDCAPLAVPSTSG